MLSWSRLTNCIKDFRCRSRPAITIDEGYPFEAYDESELELLSGFDGGREVDQLMTWIATVL